MLLLLAKVTICLLLYEEVKANVAQGPGKSWLHPRTHFNVMALRVVFLSSSSLLSSSSS